MDEVGDLDVQVSSRNGRSLAFFYKLAYQPNAGLQDGDKAVGLEKAQ